MTRVGAKKMGSRRKGELIFYLSFVVIPSIQFLIFYVLVNLNSIRLSFLEFDVVSNQYNFIWFDNFKTIWQQFISEGSELRTAFFNSFGYWAVITLIGGFLSLFFSFYIYKKMPMYKFFRVMLFLPSIISAIVLVTVYTYTFDQAYPVIIKEITGEQPMGLITNLDTRLIMVVLYAIIFGFGTQTLVYSSSMSGIDESQMEAAMLDGAKPMRTFFSIIIPQIFPTITTFVVVSIATMFVNQVNLYSFFGNNATSDMYSVGYYIYLRTIRTMDTMSDYPYIAALGIFFSLVSLPLTSVTKWLMEKFDPMRDS